MAVDLTGIETIIRPAAIVPVGAAAAILAALEDRDVSRGGVWNATPGVWQRYDVPWTGPGGSRGGSELVGSIAVVYDSPRRNEITIFKVTVTPRGTATGWTVEAICDDALAYARLTLASCPRADLSAPPHRDPFRIPAQRTGVGDVLRTDVRGLSSRR